MKKIILIFFALILLNKLQAQFLEKVYLKDSITVYEGWIIEQVPQEYLKMLRFKERDTVTIDVTDVWKIVRVLDPKKLTAFLSQEIDNYEVRSGYSRAVYLELLGNGAIYSINFDSRLKKGKRDGLGYRIGFGYFNYNDTTPGLQENVRLIAIPLEVNYLLGKRKGALELGIGTTFFSARLNGNAYSFDDTDKVGLEPFSIQSNGFIGFVNLAYRYRSIKNGLMFKVAFTPIIIPEVLPFFGLSIGYHFQKK